MTALGPTGLPLDYPFNPLWEIAPREVQRLLAGYGALLLIDVRSESEREIASIAGSRHCPFHELEEHLDALREKGEDQLIVIHCHQGIRSLRAAGFLKQAGFTNVRSMAGGIHLWSIDIDPQVPIY